MKRYLLLILLLGANMTFADSYKYEKRKVNDHIIHIVTLHPSDYDMRMVKAHDSVFGREVVSRIAERENAEIAINAGFFEIGGEKDGMPSRTLIVEGNLFGLEEEGGSRISSQLVKSGDKISIKDLDLGMKVKWNNKTLSINKYNKFPEGKELILYTDRWGEKTLTNYQTRIEAAFDSNYKFIELYDHGNNPIPSKGFILSFSKEYIVDHGLEKESPELIDNASNLQNEKISVLSSAPLLVKNGDMDADILRQESTFYKRPHARTAVGLKKDGTIVIVVAEHFYSKNPNEVTAGDIQTIIASKEKTLVKKYGKSSGDFTLKELKEIIKDTYVAPEVVVGLSIEELAKLMIELGCDSALNLDGGGSSTLWIEGKVINMITGDEDEAGAQGAQRPVSDAIVFVKK